MATSDKRKTSKRSAEVAKRNKKIADAYEDGATVPELSESFSLSTIMVYRYLKALGVALRQSQTRRPIAREMPEEVKALLADNYREDMALKEAERIAKMMAYRPPTWRRCALQRHVARVLAVRGGERIEFMDRNPVAGVFR